MKARCGSTTSMWMLKSWTQWTQPAEVTSQLNLGGLHTTIVHNWLWLESGCVPL